MTTKKHLLYSAKITNNCPECFSIEGLEFSFSQEEKETKLYSKANPVIEETLYCHHCNHTIYPVNWTQDIERVYAYHKKLAKPKSTSFRLKPLAYAILIFDTLALFLLIYFLSR
ncbi:MAG: hypothetical protein R2776_05035 [Flavobacteriaceae bacterium]|nr:hypothetical protein [Flavobacteriaceae bacterium]